MRIFFFFSTFIK